jgi:hypothetical protein
VLLTAPPPALQPLQDSNSRLVQLLERHAAISPQDMRRSVGKLSASLAEAAEAAAKLPAITPQVEAALRRVGHSIGLRGGQLSADDVIRAIPALDAAIKRLGGMMSQAGSDRPRQQQLTEGRSSGVGRTSSSAGSSSGSGGGSSSRDTAGGGGGASGDGSGGEEEEGYGEAWQSWPQGLAEAAAQATSPGSGATTHAAMMAPGKLYYIQLQPQEQQQQQQDRGGGGGFGSRWRGSGGGGAAGGKVAGGAGAVCRPVLIEAAEGEYFRRLVLGASSVSNHRCGAYKARLMDVIRTQFDAAGSK